MTKADIKKWLTAYALIISVTTPTFGALGWVFSPHIESFVHSIVREESYRLKYEYVSEMLQIFRNIPEEQRTTFHKAEIERLSENQVKLRDILVKKYKTDLL